MTNPQENIDKYKNMSIINTQMMPEKEKTEITNIYPEIPEINNKFNKNIKNAGIQNTIGNFLETNKNNNNLNETNISYSNIFGTEFGASPSINSKLTISDKEKEKDEINYVRILCIRENEHFGDVMIFLEQRSPLRVRVKSRKAELFFLKKMDAIKISTSYPNIWRRINKKSIFNFEQIKKSINKIVEIYCSVKKINTEEESSNGIYTELLKKSRIGKETVINIRKKNSDFNIINESIKKRSQSIKNKSNTSLKQLLKKSNLDESNISILKKKNAVNSEKMTSNTNIVNKAKIEIKPSLSSPLKKKNKNKNKKSVKFEKKLDNILNEKYKSNNKENNLQINNSIIKEESEKEDTISNLKLTKSFKNIQKISISPKNSKNNKNEYNNIFENKSNENNKDDNKSSLIINNKNDNIQLNTNNINILIKKTFKKLKFDDSSINDENININDKSKDNNSNNFQYDKIINDEIYPGEEIKINKEDNLLFRKVDISYPFIRNSSLLDLDKSRNSKIELLLKSIDEKELNNSININSNNISKYNNDNNNDNNNNSNNILNINKKELNEDLINIKNTKNKKWGNDLLYIKNNISFKYESSYENCNLISGQKLIRNKSNQLKLKNFLINEILNKSLSKRNTFFEIVHNKIMNLNNTQINHIETDKEKKENIIKRNTQASSFLNKQKRKMKKFTTFIGVPTMIKGSNKPKLNRTSSLNEKDTNKLRHFQDDFNNNLHFSQRKTFKNQRKRILSSKNLYNFSNEKTKKMIMKKSSIVSSTNKTKKKKDNLLSKINLNIRKTEQNLNNPEEFYSNYFQKLLEGEVVGKNKRFEMSMIAVPKSRREKGSFLKKNFTIKK